jgi:hypothetical protein
MPRRLGSWRALGLIGCFALALMGEDNALADAASCMGTPKRVGSWDFQFKNACSSAVRFIVKSTSAPPYKKEEFTVGYVSASDSTFQDSYYGTTPEIVWACLVDTPGCTSAAAYQAKNKISQPSNTTYISSDILKQKKLVIKTSNDVTNIMYIDSDGTLVDRVYVKPGSRVGDLKLEAKTWRLKLNGTTSVKPGDDYFTSAKGNTLIIRRTTKGSNVTLSWTRTITFGPAGVSCSLQGYAGSGTEDCLLE